MSASVNEQREQPPLWQWPEDDSPVDLGVFILKEWKHPGDSQIAFARPRKRRGEPTPPPAYLLKWGRDAVGERIYSLVARHLKLPSAVVFWSIYPEMPEVAIRFEPDAWRPDAIDPATSLARSAGRTVSLRNSLDYYRHLAISDFLGDVDGVEFMVRQEVLFRIDAAAVGWRLFSSALNQLFYRTQERPTEHATQAFRVTAEHLREHTPDGYQAYQDTLEQMAAWAGLQEQVAEDLRTCPAAGALLFPAPLAGSVLGEAPSLSVFADAVDASLCQQQIAIKSLLAEE